MQAHTQSCIEVMLAADKSIPESVGLKALAILNGREVDGERNVDRILTRKEMSAKLRVCPVTVTNWGKSGLLKAVRIKGRRKALGYLESSAIAIMNGTANVAEVLG